MINPDELILVSVDDHICEPRDMFDAHVPAKYRDKAPRVVEEEDGVEQWWYGNLRGRNIGLNAAAGKSREYFNLDASRYDEMRPGCFDVHERVRDMNFGGQLAGLNFPNWTGFAGQVLNQGPDNDVNMVMIQAYNDWHVDEWCGAYPERFIPCGILPMWDAELAAGEIHRLSNKGVHAVTFSENPEALNMPSIHTDFWDPVFTAACDTETVLCCHVGSASRGAQTSTDAPPSVTMALGAASVISTFGELLWANFWERFPDLKFSLTEGDIGWIPYFVARAEHVQKRHSGWTMHTFPNDGSPKDIFLEHMLCCFISEDVGIELIDRFNIDNVCWESDYPHSDCDWPNAPEVVAQVMDPLTDVQVAKITHENAMRHYHFDPFATRPKEQCTVAALRAESPDVDPVTRVGRLATERDAQIFKYALRGIKVPAGADGP
jgi:predicted TIM-barrel fold metal-dependent hydrolase